MSLIVTHSGLVRPPENQFLMILRCKNTFNIYVSIDALDWYSGMPGIKNIFFSLNSDCNSPTTVPMITKPMLLILPMSSISNISLVFIGTVVGELESELMLKKNLN